MHGPGVLLPIEEKQVGMQCSHAVPVDRLGPAHDGNVTGFRGMDAEPGPPHYFTPAREQGLGPGRDHRDDLHPADGGSSSSQKAV